MVLSFSLSLQAQSVPIPENMTSASVLKRDTAKAVHHLFRARRIGGTVNIFLGLNMISTGALFGSASSSTSILSTLPGDLIVGMGISKLIRFKKEREIDLLAAYERGVPLPEKIQRRLNSTHLMPSMLAKPASLPDTLNNLSAGVADATIGTTEGVIDTLTNALVRMPALMTVASVMHGDTVRAIHHLFSTKRGGGTIFLGIISIGLGLGIAAGVRALSNDVTNAYTTTILKSSTQAHAKSPSFLTYSLPGLIITGIGFAKSARFSKEAENLLIEAYENGIPLPIEIKQKLQTNF
ncbi:hypothetical protein CWM47_13785 [Spirosoma pollinicola]|uniref:Uncharacterized protein n=2 Tax=Spirosoma pollinicola TaxID=2057025 RepID=A0A2K8YZ37_9BACT|nr:hypothetical protein CWM47_13785 [Spirosoma pollinicola]